ncbi:MAG: F0F1 ATP synthase subunit A [Oscillospiraceae bacterium]|nr:F0F1 ATP synthase subunit A [Oscillospiraceae bacterium]
MENANLLFSIGPLQVTSTVVTMWALIAAVALVSWLATRNLREVPGPLQNLAEMAVEKLRGFFGDSMGSELTARYLPLLGTFFIFIIVCNYSGLLPGVGHVKGMAQPTANLSVTAGLGVCAFFTTHFVGVRERGLKPYLASFANVRPLILCVIMIPLNLIEQFIRPLSLALRLYGNMYGEETVTENLYELFPIGLPLIMQVLSLLFCLLQAIVFTMLLSIYISEAVETEE